VTLIRIEKKKFQKDVIEKQILGIAVVTEVKKGLYIRKMERWFI